MAAHDKDNGIAFVEGGSRHLSPPPGLRHRPLTRAATFAEPSLGRRRSSIFSESLSDAKRSFRSSTDDLLLPRASPANDTHDMDETSHWHSLPLGLALLPAAAGLFFKDGSAIITDVTLLIIAAIMMNWALRMPWEWYRTAQRLVPPESISSGPPTPIEEEDEEPGTDDAPRSGAVPKKSPRNKQQDFDPLLADKSAARAELKLHELAALFSCFLCPGLAAWLLHAIRTQLSRPSEGLVSNYNLTIFLLVAEIRPLSHLIKMIQSRTLFLQRKVNLETYQDNSHPVTHQVDDMLVRIQELESHVADGITSKESQPSDAAEKTAAKASAQAISDMKKVLQPELDALSRAMRRYEKKSTITAVQIEARLQDLEVRVGDVVVLAAAAQRSAERQPMRYYLVVANWLCAAIVVPVESIKAVLSLPTRIYLQTVALVMRYIPGASRPKRTRDGKTSRRAPKPQTHEREKRTKAGS